MTEDMTKAAVLDFIEKFELVFGEDWDLTLEILRNDEWRRYFIAPDATFLEPEMADERNNWGNRGALLESYRRLRALIPRQGRSISWRRAPDPTRPAIWRRHR